MCSVLCAVQTAGVRFNVLLASYETVLRDKGELRKLHFEVCVATIVPRVPDSHGMLPGMHA